MHFDSLGPVEPDTVEKAEVKITDEEKARQERIANRPALAEILNLHDFEVLPPLYLASTFSDIRQL